MFTPPYLLLPLHQVWISSRRLPSFFSTSPAAATAPRKLKSSATAAATTSPVEDEEDFSAAAAALLMMLVSRSGGAGNARGASSSWRRTGRPQNNRSLTRAERRSGRMRMRTPVIRSLDYYIRRSLFVVFFVRGVVWGSWGSLIVVPDKLR